MRIAVVVPTAGPYWEARGRALAAHPRVEACLLAVAARERSYGWESRPSAWRVIAPGLYEDLDWRRAARAVVDTLAAFRPEAVLTMGYSDPLMRHVARWAKARGIISLAAWDTSRADRPRAWWKEEVKRRIVRRLFDGTFATGPGSWAYAREMGFPKERIATGLAVADNAFFARRAAQARADLPRASTERDIEADFFLYVGRFAPEKNLRRLLEAYGRYRAGKPEQCWELVLVGEGEERGALEAMIAEGCLEGVRLGPWAGIEELAVWYGLASCFILPSLREPWGLVVNEAMAAGLPVLVSERCGCVPELVEEGGNGFVFDPLDAEALAGLMSRMATIEPPAREGMGRRSEEIISGYTPETWAESLVELASR